MRLEDLVLLLRGKPGKQRQHIDTGRVVLAQVISSFADLALAG